jgi:hypothetical protein
MQFQKPATQYITVAASQTTVPVGVVGCYLESMTIIPATTASGAVTKPSPIMPRTIRIGAGSLRALIERQSFHLNPSLFTFSLNRRNFGSNYRRGKCDCEIES